ncbi:1-{5-phosphoribosyl}-5-{{5-phosphoribosylamino}methylideneamino} imidazole-4-carboxamide isomerase [Geoglobus ahangari]|uniref:1-(5-phosphoribosyl)-5-[(5-phosphoribosylamino)methylideneamino] imidazole-4-carboxamide isomerase n=1 Tax=Geoglobus ahangari TaxID=113653 RepID=A0A0F7DC56_9EURY|nr:1-(5-phosphoribosyl)-5-[(5-phosphoribosylamino)methylideneamino]imidazole-4-carboxamide isomerase [Geoglobus ahangari]AKG92256.1 1-{5-phosphoribosyl}-5-{{5-phosphoribosylamino}methylideneamino} imidazole-4-carboxamide isomerase [Geoglobus ahangari]
MFRVIPAVDIKDGKCVQLRQGKEDDVIFEGDDPVIVARSWVEKGARVLHVVDLSGSFKGRLAHEDVILEISELAEVQVGGGIRDAETARRLLDLGVERVIVGTMAIERSDEVRRLAEEYPKRIMVAVDSRGGNVVVRGWKKNTCLSPVEVMKMYSDLDVSFLFTNVDVEGLMRGIDEVAVRRVVESTDKPVIVSGGITSKEDVEKVKNVGAAGVVVGSALYTGKLRFEELLSLEED